jgi:hypothetical protein
MIVQALLVYGIGLPIATVLAWLWIRHRLTVDVEKLKGRLGLDAIEHQVRFSRLYEKRAQLVANVYEQIERLHAALRGWSNVISAYGADEKGLEESRAYREQAVSARDALAQVYYPHAIWFGRDLCDELNALIDKMATLHRMLSLEHHAAVAQMDLRPEQTVDPIREAVAEMRANLETRLRRLLEVPKDY